MSEVYGVLDDPAYDGKPAEMLLFIDELLGEHDSRFKLEQRYGLEEAEPDPGLFPEEEETGLDATELLTPEAINAEFFGSFNGSAYLQRMTVSRFKNLLSLEFSLTPRTATWLHISLVGAGSEFL